MAASGAGTEVDGQLTSTEKILAQVLSGSADQNVRFEDLRRLVLALGFAERIRGSHHIYARSGIEEIINLQPRDGGLAKPYQVRQVRDLIVKYKLSEGMRQ